MWNVRRPSDGPCDISILKTKSKIQDYECLVPPCALHQYNDHFRYPVGVVPGNIFLQPEEPLYEPGTILFQIFEEIIPFIMGASVVLFFLFSTVYMLFSLIRLFYADILKPYKVRTLKALGKYEHHYRKRDSRSTISTERTPSKQSIRSKQGKRKRGRTSGYSGGGPDGDMDNLMLDETISLTSPPHRRHHRNETYPEVSELLDHAAQLPMLDRFPSMKERMWMGGRGRGRFSIIPIARNKRGELWEWDRTWYPDRYLQHQETGKALEALQSTQSMLHTAASKQFPPPEMDTQSMPNLTAPPEEAPSPKEGMEMLYQAPEERPSQVVSRQMFGETTRGLDEPLPSLTSAVGLRGYHYPPPPPTPSANLLPGGMSRAELFRRYTFRPQTTVSKFHTAIPKTDKSKCCGFMILRGGPRRKSTSIEKIRQQRRSVDAGQPEEGTANATGEQRPQAPYYAAGRGYGGYRDPDKIQFKSEYAKYYRK